MKRKDGGDNHAEAPLTSVGEQAAHWWAVLHSEGVTAADHREFREWVSRSPERVEAVLHTARLMHALEASDVPWPDTSIETLVAEAKAAPAEPIPFQVASSRDRETEVGPRRVSVIRPRLASIAATLLVVAVLWMVFTRPEMYQTELGEQRSVLLRDGSLVTLNTSSQIEVIIDDRQRTVRLAKGEALFKVAHDSRRPFEVVAGDATVRAVGTQFNVDRHAAITTVTVVEGRIAVRRQPVPDGAETLVGAAERAVITSTHVSAPERVANIAAATAWTQRRLIFERRRLGEVAAEFNRYNRMRIEIDDAELRDQQITGVFQANNPESFVTFLSKIPGVNVRQGTSSIVVSSQD